jgi:hypothetical protein
MTERSVEMVQCVAFHSAVTVFENFTKSILVGFSTVLVPICTDAVMCYDASFVCYLVCNNTCENRV